MDMTKTYATLYGIFALISAFLMLAIIPILLALIWDFNWIFIKLLASDIILLSVCLTLYSIYKKEVEKESKKQDYSMN